MDDLLREFAHAIAPPGAKTRAIVNRETGELKVFVENSRPPDGTVVVAKIGDRRRVVGSIKHPVEGWVEIDGTAYPANAVQVQGPLLFIARPLAETPDGP